MSYAWNKIEEIIERIEYDRALDELLLLEQQEGFVKGQPTLTDRKRGYLEFLGKLSLGISVGFFTLMFNFLLFVWLLHIEFHPPTAGTFEKKLKDPFATTDQALAQQNFLETFEHWAKEKSKETEHALKHAAQYVEQAATWISYRLEAGTFDVMKDARLVAGKLIESAGWGTEEVGKSNKEIGSVLPKEGFIRETEEAKKEVDGVQQHKNPSKADYTVQVGAFKNYSKADDLKTRLIKRGYNAYVTYTESERKKRIFKLCKVWIGEFNDKEEAERVSIKIEKAEGLQAFVTLKKGQESIR